MREWLRQPLAVRRWAVLAASITIGGLCAIGIVLGQTAIGGVSREREQRGREIAASIRRDILTTADVERIARRQARIERPSTAAIARRILRALRVIQRDPQLRRQLDRTLSAASDTSTRAAADTSRRTSPTSRADRRDASAAPGRRDTSPAAGARDPSPPPATTTDPSPTSPRPPVDVQTPDALPLPDVGVCTTVIGVNCGG